MAARAAVTSLRSRSSIVGGRPRSGWTAPWGLIAALTSDAAREPGQPGKPRRRVADLMIAATAVAENLALFARLERVADPDAAVERMLEQTGLHDRSGDQVARLSGGNRQRVNVAIGLLSRPAVLALDEPSTALDPGQRERLWNFIHGLAGEGTSVVFSTHDVNEVQRYAARALVLADGRLLFDGTPAAFLAVAGGSSGDFEDAFVSFLRARGHE